MQIYLSNQDRTVPNLARKIEKKRYIFQNKNSLINKQTKHTRSMAIKSLCCIHFVIDGHQRTKLSLSIIIHGTFIWAIIIISFDVSLISIAIYVGNNNNKNSNNKFLSKSRFFAVVVVSIITFLFKSN